MSQRLEDLNNAQIEKLERDLIINGANADSKYKGFKQVHGDVSDARVTDVVARTARNLDVSFDDGAPGYRTELGRGNEVKAHRGDVVEAEAIAIAKAAWDSFHDGNKRVNAKALLTEFMDVQGVEASATDLIKIEAAGKELSRIGREGNAR